MAKILSRFNFRVIFRPTNKFCFPSLKDPVPHSNRCGIYHIPCQCGLGYIGQTRRALKFRVKEHMRHVSKQEFEKSAIANHSWSFGHEFVFPKAKIIHAPISLSELYFLESFAIFAHSNSLINESIPSLSTAWKTLIQANH